MNYLIINTAVKIEILLQTEKTFYYSSAEKTMASSELLPRIEKMLKDAAITITDIDVFGCLIGPGSFTGIRIGVSTVRALCYALNKPCVAVTYFDVLSYNITAPFTALIDGSNGVCYLKNYKKEEAQESGKSEENQPLCVRNEDILKFACSDNFVADSRFTPILDSCCLALDGPDALKSAFENTFKKHGTIEYSQLIPLYLRRSQPEREAGEV